MPSYQVSYRRALEAAGAIVHVFREFGSYQGDWYAKVSYGGRDGWVVGSYGSCSECDSLAAEFGCSDEPEDDFEDWRDSWRRGDGNGTREQWQAEKDAFEARYADFGRGYLDDILAQEEAEKKAGKNLDWDSEATEMLSFVKSEAWSKREVEAMDDKDDKECCA